MYHGRIRMSQRFRESLLAWTLHCASIRLPDGCCQSISSVRFCPPTFYQTLLLLLMMLSLGQSTWLPVCINEHIDTCTLWTTNSDLKLNLFANICIFALSWWCNTTTSTAGKWPDQRLIISSNGHYPFDACCCCCCCQSTWCLHKTIATWKVIHVASSTVPKQALISAKLSLVI